MDEVGAKGPKDFSRSEYELYDEPLYIVPIEDISEKEWIQEGDVRQDESTGIYELSLNANVKKEEVENTEDPQEKESWIDNVQTFLDIAGFIPAFGAIPDVVNGIIYLCRGDLVSMSMSFVAAIPGYGDAAAVAVKSAKYAKRGQKLIKRSKIAKTATNSVSQQADFVISLAKKEGKQNISLLWTKGTSRNTDQLIKEVQKKAPHLNIRRLETTRHGHKMESVVESKLKKIAKECGMSPERISKEIESGSLWRTLDTEFHHTFVKHKPRIEEFQRNVSTRYARNSQQDVIVEFYNKNIGFGAGKIGQANKPEINILRKLRKRFGKRSLDGIIGVDPI